MKEKKKLSLAMQIFIALVLAIIAGLLMQSHADFAESYIKPFGTIFLNLVKFIVVPIVLFSIMCGIISMSDIKKVGAIGLKTVIFYLCTTAFAVTIGLTGGNLFKGLFPVVATTDLTYEAAEATSFMDTIVNIFPSNFVSPMVEANMLQIIVMAILLGFAIILVGEKNIRVVNAFNDLNEIFMKCMEMILKLSPIGVFCLLCPVIAANGPTIIGSLAMVLLAAYICYIVHIIYVKNFILRTSKDVKNNDESEESIQQNREVEEVDLSESEKSTYRGRKNRLQGVGKTDFKRSENTTYRGRKIRTTEVGKIDPINTKYNYTDISNTDRNNTDLINLSDSSEQQSMDLMEEMELFQMNTALVKRNIEYDCLVQRCRLGEQQQLDEIVALIVETISIERENITISGVKYPYQFVKSRLLLLEESHIEYVLDCLHENTREVKNIKAYLLTCLMNSITTIGNYYQAKVNHDMYGGGI